MSSDIELKEILQRNKIIAVVGASRDPEKPANYVPEYLKSKGYKIIPVNPVADEILGEKVYKSLSDIPGSIDIVDIFRPSDKVFPVVEEALKKKPKVIWMQLGIVNEEAKKLAEKSGIKVIMDKCMLAEHKKLIK